MIGQANDRCDQQNVIAQLKGVVSAMRMPVDDLVGNVAYMVMVALAWNLKAWFALMVPQRERGLELQRMEFCSFQQAIMLLPCQVGRTARRIVWRILTYSQWLMDLFATLEPIVGLEAG